MELFAEKVALVPEDHRDPIRLCPRTGTGIAKRMLVNVKNDTISWMMAKMQVRKDLLPNTRNINVLNMLKSSLWGRDIFPEEAIEKLRDKFPGVSNLKALLNMTEGRRDPDEEPGIVIRDHSIE